MIITSLLDTDLYKFTMMQVVLHHFPTAQVEYRFKCRNACNLQPYIGEIRREIGELCRLRFTRRELDYLRSWRFFKSDFVDLLGLFQLDERFIHVSALRGSDSEIDITIKGPWLHATSIRIPILPRASAGLHARSNSSIRYATRNSASPITGPDGGFRETGSST
jgi:nicotinate phosphoribosyltransferase